MMKSIQRPIDENGFVCGSIMRIEMRNFMVYEEAEFVMNPRMNMIIGPNGAGKSTVVCAIAIGLGTSTKVTGRAKDVYDHVQTNKDEASIKVILANGPGNKPISIRRKINRVSKTSFFFVDGRKATNQVVEKILDRLKIQVDNICQFLPQEKVSAIAAMSHSDLLIEVENAVGDVDMPKQHKKLCDLDEEIENKQKDINHYSNDISTLKAKNESIFNSYEGMKNRAQLVRLFDCLKAASCGAEYEKLRSEFNYLRSVHSTKSSELKTMERELRPQESQLKDYHIKLRTSREKLSMAAKKLERHCGSAKRTKDSLEEADNDLRICEAKLTADKARIVAQKLHLEEQFQELEKLRKDFAEMRSESYVEEIKEIHDKIRVIYSNQKKLAVQQAEADIECKNCEAMINTCFSKRGGFEMQLKSLQSRGSAALEYIGRTNEGRESLKAYRYIQENKSEFPGIIVGPMLLSINVPDPKYAHYIEAFVSERLLFHTFVTDDEKTYEALISRFIEGPLANRCRISVHLHQMKSIKSPNIPYNDLRNIFGFDGYLIDLVEAEEFTKNWLICQVGLDRIPFSIGEINKEEVAKYPTEFQRYVVKDVSYITKTWGNDKSATAVTTKQLNRNSKYLGKGLAVSINSQVSQIQAEITAKTSEVELLTATLHLKRSKKDTIIQELLNLRKNVLILEEQKTKFENASGIRAATEKTIFVKEETLKNQNLDLEETEKSLNQKKSELSEWTLRKFEMAKGAYVEAFKIVESVKEKREFYLQSAYLEHEIKHFISTFSELKLELDNKRSELFTLSNDLTNIRSLADKKLQDYRELCVKFKSEESNVPEVAEARNNAITEYVKCKKKKNKSQEQIDDCNFNDDNLNPEFIFKAIQWKLIDVSAQLENTRVDSSVVEIYENRDEKIQAQTKLLDRTSKELENIVIKRKCIAEIWLAKTTALIESVSSVFSDYCSRIGCTGEVGLNHTSKFVEYAVEIRVKFHDHQEMHVLDKARQSGGERAVSTILFLLSLQRFSASPLILVDEINQGMDATNERAVHEMIVELSQESNAPQTYIITPKLLTDLNYSSKLTVHCIFNGPRVSNDLVDSESSFRCTSEYIKNRQKLLAAQ